MLYRKAIPLSTLTVIMVACLVATFFIFQGNGLNKYTTPEGSTSLGHLLVESVSGAARISPFYLDVTGEVQDNSIVLIYAIGELTEVKSPEEICPDGGTEDCGVYIAGPVQSFATENSELSINIPEGLEIVSGKPSWKGDLKTGDAIEVMLRIKPSKNGIYEIVATATAGRIEPNPLNADIKETRIVYLFVNGTTSYINRHDDWCPENLELDAISMMCIEKATAIPVRHSDEELTGPSIDNDGEMPRATR